VVKQVTGPTDPTQLS